uniref:non-specific serine/threonine protein kinase n=1 Tax=Albugo laibachii Nc14 TaxID=890382 RepID=F0WX20_9STRA|nr:CBLinteracting serine/threonineprotein kinase putati [Albugo laibachii Nc14]|eukprot:CCA26008.1 CBLinteracting serine/threonineprotein kinase putati [Albugo laibachii Nc14]
MIAISQQDQVVAHADHVMHVNRHKEQQRSRMLGKYIVRHTLGSGLQGKVKLGIDVETRQMVALKIIDGKTWNRKSLTNISREIEAMSRINHPNVLKLIEVFDNLKYWKKNGSYRDVVLIVLELANGGELFAYMMYTGAFSENVARIYFLQLINGLDACHSTGVYHRDIKPENLLLDENFQLKIADFGLSNFAELTADGVGKNTLNDLYTQCGTKSYMSPEILAGVPYDGGAADVWSAGVVLFIMLAAFPPFQTATQQDWWFRSIAADRYDAFWDAHARYANFSEEAKDLLSRVFKSDPKMRITIAEIKKHPWCTKAFVINENTCADLLRRKHQVEEEKRRERAEGNPTASADLAVDSTESNDANGSLKLGSYQRQTTDEELRYETCRMVTGRSLESIGTALSDTNLDPICFGDVPMYPCENVMFGTAFEATQSAEVIHQRIKAALESLVNEGWSASFVCKKDGFKTKVMLKAENVECCLRVYAHPHTPGHSVAECRRIRGRYSTQDSRLTRDAITAILSPMKKDETKFTNEARVFPELTKQEDHVIQHLLWLNTFILVISLAESTEREHWTSYRSPTVLESLDLLTAIEQSTIPICPNDNAALLPAV